MKTPARVGLLLALAGSIGCSSSPAPPDTQAFATTASAVVTSDAKLYRIALYSAPDARPTRGMNSLRLVVTKIADGSPATGLDIDLVPWMPAMGHGTSVQPTIDAASDPGVYVVSSVALFMQGLWEFRTTIGGPSGDHATAQFEIQ